MSASARFGDKIILSDLAFYGYHGVMAEENSLGQRFNIDLECGLDLRAACESDEVNDTVSYVEIYDLVRRATEETKYKLIEALAAHIVEDLFSHFPTIKWVKIRIGKPKAPIRATSGEFAVEIYRER